MALNAARVLVGTADQQSTTGAIRNGDILTGENIPTSFEEAEAALEAMNNSGYVSEDGLELANDMSTTEIREWNRNIVRKLLDSYDGTIKWSLIQQDYESWCQAIGEEHVTKTDATAEHGEQLHIGLGAHLAPPQAYGFAMKDGKNRIIVIVPNSQISNLESISFNATSAIALPVTLSCYDDGTGDSIHIFTDDGQVISASTPSEDQGEQGQNDQETDFESMTKAELLEYCTQNNIEGANDSMTKAEIIALIEAAQNA
ncbi:MAG: hypothetical protein IJ113_06050 [Eggerthellaceae bacterium]|nr:hypothetical protein [Eggerthellaceae bacterium]